LPFFALGAAAGLVTAVFERKLIGAEGAAFDLSILDRSLIGGRAIWFYLGKLFWPTDLTFIYPRWHVDPSDWRQYLYPAAAIGLLAAAWAMRRRRGPLAALLFFIGTLFPVLGFCNVFPFIYSFVADHFQYLASLGVIALVSAGAALLWQRLACVCLHTASFDTARATLARSASEGKDLMGPRLRFGLVSAAGIGLCLALLTVLGTLTWRQSRMYADVETLYQTTIDRNPDCWMAENNLGAYLADQKKFVEAMPHYLRALEIKPNYVEAINNLGVASAALGRTDEAIARYQQALKIKPDYAEAHYNLANALVRSGRLDEAIGQYQQALEDKPYYVEACNNLGAAWARKGLLAEAMECYRRALEIKPDYAGAYNNLADAYAQAGRLPEALAAARQALQLATQQNNRALADASRARIALYEAGRASGMQ